ncbi:hypothetical protein [Tissierella sp. Yu-01]|uniref:hypothetical protein n=1 Tax=Tissierella sp. Yu-01 TaxID=3035694 RepID=UPI00240E973C|nr:hypothetical protein [Tissierella sp. Yu-01]WFA10042.1 hypothetical protein P3962_05670 [Tissierella sp. Yu-01]
MRKYNLYIVILLLIFSFTSVTNANSGPTYWRGYPSLEVLAVDENSTIKVENEELIFDFSKEEYLDYHDYSLSGLVTARYAMSNSIGTHETVLMAFPFISSIDTFNPSDIIIRSDELSIPYKIYIGDEYRGKSRNDDVFADDKLEFKNIVNSISDKIYSPKYYDLDEVGTLYTYEVKTQGDEVRIAIDYTIDREKTKIISKGFNGMYMDGNEESITTWIYENETLEVFMLGEDIELNFNGYSDGELKNVTDKYSYELKTEEITIRDYITKEVEAYKAQFIFNDYLAENQLFNLCAKSLDESIEKNIVNLHSDELFSIDIFDRIFVLLYEVEFLPKSSKNIEVSYLARGTMDSIETTEPLYKFDYLLNPASNWASFKDLSIEIIPPKEHPYVIDSSIELIRNENGIYSGEFESLPNEDLSFTLYSNEEITLMDKVKRKISRHNYLLLETIAFIILIIIAVFRLVRNRKKKNN